MQNLQTGIQIHCENAVVAIRVGMTFTRPSRLMALENQISGKTATAVCPSFTPALLSSLNPRVKTGQFGFSKH
jgi:hypothetical protein